MLREASAARRVGVGRRGGVGRQVSARRRGGVARRVSVGLAGIVGRAGTVWLLGALALPSIAGAQHAPDCNCGTVTQFTYYSPSAAITGPESFTVFTPDGYTGRASVPLVVFVHGCNTSAARQEGASNYDRVAERDGFIVMYPDDNDSVHPLQCWQYYSPTSWARGAGDVATIAAMTRNTMLNYNVDPQRVYEIGMSSGALLTSDVGATYPDLFTAIGIMAGGPFAAGATCYPTTSVGAEDPTVGGAGGLPVIDPQVDASARAARLAEGRRARVVPFIVLNGDADTTVDPACGAKAVGQWLQTDRLVLTQRLGTAASLAPSRDTRGQVPGGYSYDAYDYTGPNGCLVGRHLLIHQMGHFWSGGTTDPAYANWTDPRGPSAAEASWAFFSGYTRSTTGIPCSGGRGVGLRAGAGHVGAHVGDAPPAPAS